jgi:hypothetical protein
MDVVGIATVFWIWLSKKSFKSISPSQYHWQNLEVIKVAMDQSNLPHNQVKQVIGAIDSLQKDLQRGLTIDSTAAPKSK